MWLPFSNSRLKPLEKVWNKKDLPSDEEHQDREHLNKLFKFMGPDGTHPWVLRSWGLWCRSSLSLKDCGDQGKFCRNEKNQTSFQSSRRARRRIWIISAWSASAQSPEMWWSKSLWKPLPCTSRTRWLEVVRIDCYKEKVMPDQPDSFLEWTD